MYFEQIGHGGAISKVYIGSPHQRGRGVGSYLSGVIRKIIPLIKSGAQTLGKEFLRLGLNIVSDVVTTNTSPKESFRTRVRESRDDLKRKASKKFDEMLNMTGDGGYKAKRARLSEHLLNSLSTISAAKKKNRKKPKFRKKVEKKISNKKTKAQKLKKKKKKNKKRKRKNNNKIDIFS